MSSLYSVDKNTFYCLIGTALIWIALWFMADFILIGLDYNKQIIGCLTIFVIGLSLLYYGDHDKPHGEN